MNRRIAVVAFTQRGTELSHAIKAILTDDDVDIFDKTKQSAADFVGENFNLRDAFIFIGAAGIAVRLVAKHIKKKDVDPAVIVIDELGDFVIPILSGHIGGGNELAEEISDMIRATPVITTATDINKCFAVDVWATKLGCAIPETGEIKHISSAVLNGQKIGLFSDGFDVEGEIPPCFDLAEKGIGVSVSLSGSSEHFEKEINIVPKIVTLGAGCRRGTPEDAFEAFILGFLEDNGICIAAVRTMASLDLKANEECMLAFSKKYCIPFVTYTAEQLNEVEGEFSHSDFVFKTTGVDNICERSASAEGGKLIIRKTAENGMTAAAALQDWKCKF